MTPGFARPRSELPWLPYEEHDRVIINAHRFGGSWTPAQITTELWLDAADAATIYSASSGGSLVADGGSVGRVEDKSGNARHATQATSGNRPVRSGSTISFSAKWLSVPTAAFALGRCIIGVFNSSVTGADGLINIHSSPVDNPEIRIGGLAGSGNFLLPYWGGGYVFTANAAMATSSVFSVSFTTGIVATVWRNGTQLATGTRAGTWSSISEFTIGAYLRVSSTRNGTLRELIICDPSNRQITEGYLAWKWSLQGSLDASHPYKTIAP